MKKQSVLTLLLLAGVGILSGQSFFEAFKEQVPFQPEKQYTAMAEVTNRGRLLSGTDIQYQTGLSVRETMVRGVADDISLLLETDHQPLVLKAQCSADDTNAFHLLLTTRKGALLETFPLRESTSINCKHLRPGTYFLQLCSRDQALPIKQYKLVRY